MISFLEALFNPSMPFVRNALLAGLLSSVLFGVLGTIVTVKRIAGLAGAISHAVLGGIGMALYFSTTGKFRDWSSDDRSPSCSGIGGDHRCGLDAEATGGYGEPMRSWAIGMSIGVLFMAKTPGYTDPTSYLFGNILLVSNRDLLLLGALDLVVVLLAWRFYPQLEATSFDDEFAQVRGISTHMVFLILLGVTAVAIVLLQTFVGIVMVIAMLTLPAGTAGFNARNMLGMMVLAWLYASLFSVGGLVAGWTFDCLSEPWWWYARRSLLDPILGGDAPTQTTWQTIRLTERAS